MALKVTKVQIWAGRIEDRPGGLAGVLERLAQAGADLDCVIARRQPEHPGSGVVFLTPVKGTKATAAAKAAGLGPGKNLATLRVEGANKKGLGGQMMRAIADAGVNVRGVSAAVIGKKFVAYVGLDTAADASKAARAIERLEKPVKRGARRAARA